MSEPVVPGSPRPVRGAVLAAAMGLTVVEAVEIIHFFVRLHDLRRYSSTSTAAPGHHPVLNALRLVGLAVAGTTFLVWLFQARRRAKVIGGAVQRWSTPWLVLGWVIPVVSLWIPRRIVIDIWKASEPDRRSYALVNVWWACFLAGNVGGNLLASVLFVGHDRKAANVVYVAMSAFAIAAAVLACSVIREISRAQERAGDHVAAASAAADLLLGTNPQPTP